MNKVLTFSALVFAVLLCCEQPVETSAYVEEITFDCGSSTARGLLMATNATLVGLEHPFPDNLEKIKRHYIINDDTLAKESRVLTYLTRQHQRKVRLNYYFINDQPLIIEKQVLGRIDTLAELLPYLLDSLHRLEYYYLSDTCCAMEHYSDECLTGGVTRIDEGPCRRELEVLKGLMEGKALRERKKTTVKE